MKKSLLIMVIAGFLLIGFPEIQAQTIQKNLNQVELMQKMAGTWKCNISKDTICYWNAKPYGTGLEANFQYITKGKTVSEGKELDGFEKEIDKYIILQILSDGNIFIGAQWFISKSKMVEVKYNDIPNPEKADWKIEGELKSPDLLIETTIINNKPVKIDTWTLVK